MCNRTRCPKTQENHALRKMKSYQIKLGAGTVGIFAGIFIASGGFRDSLAKTISIAGGAVLPAISLTHFIVDTRATRKINESNRRADDTDIKLTKTNKELEISKTYITKVSDEFLAYSQQSEQNQSQLTEQLENISKALELSKTQFVSAEILAKDYQ